MRFFSGAVLTPVAFIVLAEAAPLSADAHACVVAGGEITLADADVTVRPPGGDPFELQWLKTQHIKATVPAKPGARTAIRVQAAISFKATAAWLWYHLARTVKTSSGMVKLHRGARLADARATGNDVVGAVVMDEGSDVPGEPAETAGPVRVPCSALTLGVEYDDESEESSSGDGTWWQTRKMPARIQLHARPDPNSAALVLAAHAGGGVPIVFARLEVKGSWMRIRRSGAYAEITGWAPVADLDQTPDAPSGAGGGDSGGPGLGGSGPRAKSPFYEGPAHIARGTTIYAEPGSSPWARVVSRDELFKIRYDRGNAWAEVIEIPGISGPEIRAYVRVSATRQAH